jgi:competence protein ComGB
MKKRDDQGKLLKRIGDLLLKGYSFSEAIDFLLVSGRSGPEKLKKSIIHSLQKGESLSSIFDRLLKVPSQVSAQIFFAEHHGQMGTTLVEAGHYLIKKNEEKQKLVKIIQYPVFLVIVAILLMVLLHKVLFPRFQALYSSIGYDETTSIRYLVLFIEKFPFYFFVFLIILTFVFFLLFMFKDKLFQVKHLLLLSKLPLLSLFIKLGHTHFFAREFSFLLRNGVSITEALIIIEKQSYRPVFQYISKKLLRGLREGEALHKCISKVPLFKKELSFVIAHGQTNGRLADELQMYSEICFTELEEKGNRILKYIQPTIFAFVGLFIMAIYFSIMMPLFKMMQGI